MHSAFIRRDFYALNRVFWNAFKPNRLPYSADGRVPHSSALFFLLAPRITVVKVVEGDDAKLVFAVFKSIGYIKREGNISADIASDALAV